MSDRSEAAVAEAESHEAEPSKALTEEEVDSVDERRSGSAKVVHEVIRLQGDEELDRPLTSLLFSGFAAGVALSVSILAEAYLQLRLPDAPWAELVSSIGYTVGYVIVILGGLQLFTENTVTAVLPLATNPSFRNLGRLGRLWTAVLFANLVGTLFVAVLIAREVFVDPEQLEATLEVSRVVLSHDALKTLLLGMPAGFLVASIAWILPNARGNEFWVIVLIAYVIALGGFSHVVAGSGEAWLLWLSGEIGLSHAITGVILPTLIGNIIGGTGLFAVLAHGQVRSEIEPEGDA